VCIYMFVRVRVLHDITLFGIVRSANLVINIGFSIAPHCVSPSPSSSPSSPCHFCSGYLGADEEYIVVPTTFGDGKLGSFVVSVTSTSDFSFYVEKK
jgi:hypothetical protein